jgi:outer membrane lipoprotein SlyB
MKTFGMAAALALSATALGGCATSGGSGGWAYGDRSYASRGECLAAKRESRNRGAVVGAVGGAATGAVLGGNLGEAAVAAGAGALAGGAIGNARRC